MKTVFIASSRKYYDGVKAIKVQLDALGVKGFYPYFELTNIEEDEEAKKSATMRHFPELDRVDALYVFSPDGYVGCSVTIETAYAFAKGKEIISSEPVSELAVRGLVSRVMTPDEFVKYCISV